MTDSISGACKEYLNRLRLRFTPEFAPKLEEKVRGCIIGCDADFKLIEEEGSGPRVVANTAHGPCEDVWLIPHVISTTRSKLFQQLENDKELQSECARLVRLPKGAGVDESFTRFWRWCTPNAIENNEDRFMEVQWHLLPRNILWIPHADDGNVAVCPLPQSITGAMSQDFPNGLSMMFVLQPLKAGQALKRDLLPVRRTLQRVARLVMLIGDDPDRWAHPTERQGLNQVYQCAAPPSPMLWDPVKDLGDKGDLRPRMAATEFSPEVIQVYTDYPLVAEALTHESFQLVPSFEACHILFASNPIAGFFAMGQRMVNQFPHDQCVINLRLLMHSVRLSAQPHPNGAKAVDQKGQALSLPPWFSLMFDLKTELNHFLAEHKRRKVAGQNNFWMIRSGDPGNDDWCLTDDACTIVKYNEANSGNWIIQKAINPPLLIGGKKLTMAVFLLVRSFSPLDAYMFKNMYGRLAMKEFSVRAKSLQDPTVHTPHDASDCKHLSMDELKEAIGSQHVEWPSVEASVQKSLKGLLEVSKQQMGEWPRSRALYRVDFGLPQVSSGEEFHPKIVTVGFAPNLEHVLTNSPNFVNDMFEVLFLDGPIPDPMVPLK
ncbi:hypothetical protein BSKO_01595 [Bryopsis sp. KO-2023]|nr:hypothetical protein BSKO_01595 [Bryopsis sp. KO-2023]